MDGEEGGGKAKLSSRKHKTKPYDRPKSFFRRGLDAIKTFVHQTIAPSFLQPPLSPSSTDGLNDDFAETEELEDAVNRQSIVAPSSSASALSSTSMPLSQPLSFSTPSSSRLETEQFRPLPFQGPVSNSECNRPWKGTNNSSSSTRSFSNIRLDIGPSSSSFQPAKDVLSDDHSECSDNSVSTSGCSSLIPHPDKRDYQKEFLNMSDASLKNLASKLSDNMPTARPPLHSGSASTFRKQRPGVNHVTKSSLDQSMDLDPPKFNNHSTWSEEKSFSHSLPQPRATGNKPTFNVSAFGSPIWSEKSILNESTLGSPFYSGKTMYGGASATKKPVVHVSSPYMSPNLAKHHKVNVKMVQTDMSNVEIMSSTARRILDTLEKMSTPVQDAKKIPTNFSYMDSPLSFQPSPSLRRPISRPNTPYSRGPPVAKVLTPSFASTAMNLQNRLPKDASKVSKGIKDSTSESEVVHSLPNTSTSDVRSRVGGKMMLARKEVQHYSSKTRREDLENVEPVSLPNVPLPITTLPKFHLSTGTNGSTDTKSCEKYKFAVPSMEERIPFTTTSEIDQAKIDEFVFHPPKDSTSSPCSTNFTFGSPSALNSPPTSQLGLNFQVPKTSTKLVKKMEIEKEISSPVAGGFGAATELKSGSVMDILRKSVETPKDILPVVSTTMSLLDKFKPAAGSWECSVCMIRNKPEDKKCAACETLRPSSKDTSSSSASASKFTSDGVFGSSSSKDAKCETLSSSSELKSSSSFGDKFKPAADTWECDTCMVRNKNNVKKCIACNSPRTTSAPTSSGPSVSFGTSSPAFKMPTNAPALAATASDGSGFKFGVGQPSAGTSSSGFKFGFGASSGSATAAPTTTSPASLTFPTVASTNQSADSSSGFKFGSSSTTSDTATAPFKFGFGASNAIDGNIGSTVASTASTPVVPTFSFASSTPGELQKSLQVTKFSEQITECIVDDDDADEPPPAKQAAKRRVEVDSSVASDVGSAGMFKFPVSKPTTASEEAPKEEEKAAGGSADNQFSKIDTKMWNVEKPVASSDATVGGFTFNVNPVGAPVPITPSGNVGFGFSKPEISSAGSSAGGFSFNFGASKPQEKEITVTNAPAAASSGGFVFNPTETNAKSTAAANSSTPALAFPLTTNASLLTSSATVSTSSNGAPFTFGSQLPVATSSNLFGSVKPAAPMVSATKEQSTFSPSPVFGASAPSSVIQPSTTTSASIFGASPAVTAAASGSIFGNPAPATTASGVFGSAATMTAVPSTGNVFGSGTTITAAPTTGNVFGSAATITAAPTTGNVFGSATAVTTASNFFSAPISAAVTTASLPAFGTFQTPATTAPAFGSTAGFSFGATANAPAFSGFGSTGNPAAAFKTVTTASTQPSFNTITPFAATATPSPFGASAATTGTTPTTSAAGNLFSFSGASTASAGNIFGTGGGATGFGTTTTTASASPFSSVPTFGASSQSAGFGNFGTPSNPPPPAPANNGAGQASFNFGGSAAGNFGPAPPFQFGGNQPQSASLFTFTGNLNNPTQAESTSSVMAFGTPNPVPTAPAAAPTFPANMPPPAFSFANNSNVNPFQFNAGPQSTPQSGSTRPIRRAVRRNRK